jgi:hypothetical protein
VAAAGTRATPSAAPTNGADLGPTVTVLAATGTALSGTATSVAAAATAAAARTPVVRPTATLAVIDLSSREKKERCRFELLLPVLAPRAAYTIQFGQRQAADVVLLWSDEGGSVVLDHVDDSGAAQTVARGSGAGAGVIVRDAAPGGYRAHLVRGSGVATDSRVALFYDTGGVCIPGPAGTEDGGTDTGGGDPSGGAPGAEQPAANPTVSVTAATPTAAPTQAATAVPAAATAPAPTVAPTAAVVPTVAAPASPTAMPVRPYVDCRPYLRGPSGVLELAPKVWTDAERSVLGAWPLHAHVEGPGVDEARDFRAAADAAPEQFRLGGFGAYHLKVDADGADLDPDCDWGFEHDRYT